MNVRVNVTVRVQVAPGVVTETRAKLDLEQGSNYQADPVQGAINNGLEGARKIVQTTLEKRA